MGRLILLSDLWGATNSNWVSHYEMLLKNYGDIQWYDCRVLGQVSLQERDEHYLHAQFIHSGIDKAVLELLKEETNSVDVLGFSMGGTIAWKAALSGLPVRNLFAVSSTRLRYETQKPSGHVELFFGSKDANLPTVDWFNQMNISCHIFDNETHQLYSKPEMASQICRQINNAASRHR